MKDLPNLLSQATNIAREFGVTRLLLFGSAMESPERARDLDMACAGVPGWRIFELAAALEFASPAIVVQPRQGFASNSHFGGGAPAGSRLLM